MTTMTKEQLRQKIRQEGAPAAYNALMRVFENPNSSPTALAGAARTMMELSGLMKGPTEDGHGKEPHEMSAEELQNSIDELRRRLRADSDEDVFG